MKVLKSLNHYHLLVLGIFLIINGYSLFSDGMFMDGLIYSSISRNLAEGQGTFWFPFFSETLFLPSFHEHPPLALFIQSILFKTFGDYIFIERIYSVIIFITTDIFIIKIWNLITSKHKQSWLPVLLWILIPVVNEGFQNNLLENTMTLFVVTSVFFYLRSQISNSYYYNLFLSGVCLLLAFLCKGFPSLFIWSLPLWFMLFKKDFSLSRFIRDTFLLISFTILPLLIIFIISRAPYESLMIYIKKQVIGSVGNIQTVDTRFHILFDFISHISIILMITALLYFFKIIKDSKPYLIKEKLNIWLIPLILSGVIPIMISLKQRPFYVISVYPFVGILFALLISQLTKNKFINISKSIAYLSVIIGVTVSIIGSQSINRDVNKIHDVKVASTLIEKHSIIKVNQEIQADWSLHGYFMRYNHVSICRNFENNQIQAKYLFSDTELGEKYKGIKLEKVKSISLKKYFLYQLIQ